MHCYIIVVFPTERSSSPLPIFFSFPRTIRRSNPRRLMSDLLQHLLGRVVDRFIALHLVWRAQPFFLIVIQILLFCLFFQTFWRLPDLCGFASIYSCMLYFFLVFSLFGYVSRRQRLVPALISVRSFVTTFVTKLSSLNKRNVILEIDWIKYLVFLLLYSKLRHFVIFNS